MRSSTPAIVVYSTAGTIIGWDIGAEQSFGYAAEDMMGRSIYNLVRDAGGPVSRSVSCATQGAVRCECIAQDGTMLSVLSTRSPVVNAEQKLIALCDVMIVTGTRGAGLDVERPRHRVGESDPEHPLLKTIGRPVDAEEGGFIWNGVVLDVIERKRIEAHQTLLRRQLESDLDVARAQKLEALAALAGRIAHDFNNVLFAIVGNTTLALDALPIGSPLRQYLREISGASARAVELVRQMLAFTQSMESWREQSLRAAPERPSTVPLPVSQTGALPPAEGRYKRILFVDDDPMLVTLGKNVLSRLGYDPHAFEDARQALAAFGEDPRGYAAVVTDLSMPSMSGLELSQSLLAIRPDLPILMVSGYIGHEERANGERLGIRQLVSKPISMQRLGELLSKLC